MKKKINCETECVVKDTNHNTYIRIDKLKAYFDKINGEKIKATAIEEDK